MNTHTPPSRVLAAAIALCASAILLSACASSGKVDPSRDTTSFSSAQEGLAALVGNWKLIELDGAAIETMVPADMLTRDPMFTIHADGTVGGFSGVNQFGSDLQTDALTRARFALGPIAMTRMAGPSELMGIENRMTLAFSSPRRFSLRGNTLTLMPAEGRADPMLRFKRLPTPPPAPAAQTASTTP